MNAPEIFRILQVVFGIGLVIFVHEAGHFIAARMCGVRVDVFSLGFGPRLFGWRRGATTYQVAAIPVGGYVKMAGEMADGSGRRPREDDLVSKSVGQRFFIYSGGVLMNVVFALIVFPIVLFNGVPTSEPIVVPAKGSPAWQAGLPSGSRILSVAGDEVYDFFHIPNEVALAGEGKIEFVFVAPGASETSKLEIEPVYSEQGGFRQVGVRPGVDPELRLLAEEGGQAWTAGLRNDDRLVGVVGAPDALPPLEQYLRALDRRTIFELRADRAGEEVVVSIEPEFTEADRRILGIGVLSNVVGAWRPGNPFLERLGLVENERLVAIDGHSIFESPEVLDALLAGPADGFTPQLAEGAGPEFVFEREDGTSRRVRLEEALSSADAVALDANLFLTFDESSTRVFVQPERAAAIAGLRNGDRILAVGLASVTTWPEIIEQTQSAAKTGKIVMVAYERRAENGNWERGEVALEPLPQIQASYSLGLRAAQGIYRTDSLVGSITAGFDASWRFLTDAWLTLKKMLTAQVSTENLGGIITIGTVSYSFAADGWAKLFFFLCMLSINLAFINVLPIPVLDGGHLFFCIVEAVKGSPVSERTLGYSQVVGLVLILTLMVYVTYQDVMRILLLSAVPWIVAP